MNPSFSFFFRLKRALNRYKNSLISKPNKKNSQAGKIRFISMFGCSHPFPFWVHPFALFCTPRKRPGRYLVAYRQFSGNESASNQRLQEKELQQKKTPSRQASSITLFNKLMFVTVGGRPGLASRRAVATNGNSPPFSLPRPLLFYAGGGLFFNTNLAPEGGV